MVGMVAFHILFSLLLNGIINKWNLKDLKEKGWSSITIVLD
jgi:hypothetical protein